MDAISPSVLPVRGPLHHEPMETPPRAPSPVHRFGTLAVHAGAPVDPTTGAVIAPVCPLALKSVLRGGVKSSVWECEYFEALELTFFSSPHRRYPCPPLLHRPALESRLENTSTQGARTRIGTSNQSYYPRGPFLCSIPPSMTESQYIR